jgi:hypothetical protein
MEYDETRGVFEKRDAKALKEAWLAVRNGVGE